jgi:hypothetical protein
MCPLLFLLCHFPLVVGQIGKTSLVLWYVNNVFSDKQEATVQASYLTKRLLLKVCLLLYLYGCVVVSLICINFG